MLLQGFSRCYPCNYLLDLFSSLSYFLGFRVLHLPGPSVLRSYCFSLITLNTPIPILVIFIQHPDFPARVKRGKKHICLVHGVIPITYHNEPHKIGLTNCRVCCSVVFGYYKEQKKPLKIRSTSDLSSSS